MKRWTAEDLERLGACADQVELFRATFPDGATADDVPRAVEVGLDVRWLVDAVVSDEAWAEYERQRAPLWAEYKRQRAPLLAEYERQRDALWAEFKRQRAPLLAAALRTVSE